MMSTLHEAARQALKALEEVDNCTYINDYGDAVVYTSYEREVVNKAIDALYTALDAPEAQHDRLLAEIDMLRAVCSEAYQFAGAYGAPQNVLDNLSAAANGEPLPNQSFLPVNETLKESK